MQTTGDDKGRPSWRLSCHTYSYPEIANASLEVCKGV